MKRKVNIIYEVNNREYDNCVLLRQELKRRGFEARIFNKTEDVILSNRDAISIIPNSYRKEDLDHYRYTFNMKNNLTVVYPCEQVINHQLPEYFDYSENNPVKALPHLCWGEDYHHFITELDFKTEFKPIVGALQLDFCRHQFKDLYFNKEELSKKFNLPLNKKWVLFISDFVFVSDMMTERIIGFGDAPEELLRTQHKGEVLTSDTILQWFEKFLIENNDYVLIYRKHPLEMITDNVLNMQKKYPEQFFLICDLNIKEWIFNCDCITTWNSTATIECFAAERKICLLRPYDLYDTVRIKEYPFFENFNSAKDYKQFVTQVKLAGCDYTQEFIDEVNKLYSIEETPAFIRVADAIENLEKHWEKPLLEKRYFFKKWSYYLKNLMLLKIFIKKVYQFLYSNFGFDLSVQTESKRGIKEWNASVDNKKHDKEFSRKIDGILKQYF